ncbi:MAG: hypothetical protein WB974_10115, partial [Acidobacteriaceae bacterium]
MRKPRLVFGVVCALTVVAAGCSSKSSAASGGDGGTNAAAAVAPAGSGSGGGGKAGSVNYVGGSPLSGQLTTATITDPSLNNVQAMALTIPAGWKLQGMVMVSPCTMVPSPIFRSYSAD